MADDRAEHLARSARLEGHGCQLIVGIAAHSDFECFTILLQGGPGLQVMNAEDDWIEAPPIPGCFIVNVGDIFETWSGGQFKSTQHRVVNIGRESGSPFLCSSGLTTTPSSSRWRSSGPRKRKPGIRR